MNVYKVDIYYMSIHKNERQRQTQGCRWNPSNCKNQIAVSRTLFPHNSLFLSLSIYIISGNR